MGSSSELILALDAGTQSVRAIIFDLAGNVLGLRKESLPPWDAPSPGWAETPAGGFLGKTVRRRAGAVAGPPGVEAGRGLRDPDHPAEYPGGGG